MCRHTVYWTSLTSVTEEEAADPSQQWQSDEVSQAGCDGRGHVIRVDAHFPGADYHRHHHQACQCTRWQDRKRPFNKPLLSSMVYSVLVCAAVCAFIWPRDSAAMKAVLTLLAHRMTAWITSTFPLVRNPRPTAATAARKPTTVAWTWMWRTKQRDMNLSVCLSKKRTRETLASILEMVRFGWREYRGQRSSSSRPVHWYRL